MKHESVTGPSRRTLLVGGGAGIAAGALGVARQAAAGTSTRRFHTWHTSVLSWGTGAGTRQVGNAVTMTAPVTRRVFTDPVTGRTETWEAAYWTTNVVSVGFNATELIGSWDVLTPGRSWVETEVRFRDELGRGSKWFSLGRWCQATTAEGGGIARQSVTGQAVEQATVDTDTLRMLNGHSFTSVQLRVTFLRPVGATYSPSLYRLSAISSRSATVATAATPGPARGITLPVPTYSQETHAGHYPAWGGGGEAWCSATSVAMIVAYWGRTPSSTELGSIYAHPDRQVDYSAGRCYDHVYRGTGNWPFNTAYAATRGLDTFVTRLRHLGEAEQLIAARIPLAIATSFSSSEMSGAGYSTNGHLMVIAGFTSAGDVVMNDPASHLVASDAQVRVTYRRSEVERAWARSGHTTYVIRRPDVPLPPRGSDPAW